MTRAIAVLVSRTDLRHTGILKVIRDKQTLDSAGHDYAVARAGNPRIRRKSTKPDLAPSHRFGLHVKDLSADLAKELGLDAPGGVVMFVGVSPAAAPTRRACARAT